MVRYCRRQCIDATLEYEVVPDKKERKERECQLISELNPVFNMGTSTPESAKTPNSGWRSDIHSLAFQLMDEGVSSRHKQGTPEYHDEANNQIDTTVQWFEYAWDYFSNYAIPHLYENYLPNNRTWIEKVEKDFGKIGWEGEYIDTVTASDGAEVLPETTLDSKRLWVESEKVLLPGRHSRKCPRRYHS
jgi:hypothetical protein